MEMPGNSDAPIKLCAGETLGARHPLRSQRPSALTGTRQVKAGKHRGRKEKRESQRLTAAATVRENKSALALAFFFRRDVSQPLHYLIPHFFPSQLY